MGINFQNVDFKYAKKASKKQLDNINLSIDAQNEFIFIVGHTGSGKSTLVQHMNALLFPTSGKIKIFDLNVVRKKKTPLKPIRKHVGLVFQFPEYQVFETTVLDDIMFGPKNFGQTKEQARSQALEAAKLIGISDDLLERSPFTLSGGQMRKVAIAGILAVNPDILILDEPTVGLDPKTKDELMQLLVDIQQKTNKTIIMISHDMNIVSAFAKRILVMHQGKLVFDGHKDDLFASYELLDLYNLDLPTSASLAIQLKQAGLINYDKLPLTKEDLLELILKEGSYE